MPTPSVVVPMNLIPADGGLETFLTLRNLATSMLGPGETLSSLSTVAGQAYNSGYITADVLQQLTQFANSPLYNPNVPLSADAVRAASNRVAGRVFACGAFRVARVLGSAYFQAPLMLFTDPTPTGMGADVVGDQANPLYPSYLNYLNPASGLIQPNTIPLTFQEYISGATPTSITYPGPYQPGNTNTPIPPLPTQLYGSF